jgi:hypothetical protein
LQDFSSIGSVLTSVTSVRATRTALAPLGIAVVMEFGDRYAFGTGGGKPWFWIAARRPQYHPKYYGAFVLDRHGNNIEAVHHG